MFSPITKSTTDDVKNDEVIEVAISFSVVILSLTSKLALITTLSKNDEEVFTSNPPVTYKSPSIDAEVFTLNPYSGSVDAVTLPLAINVLLSTSSASAERGISNKSLPLPLNEPLNSSALTIGTSIVSVTINPPLTIVVPIKVLGTSSSYKLSTNEIELPISECTLQL